jgi:hypothetical protein
MPRVSNGRGWQSPTRGERRSLLLFLLVLASGFFPAGVSIAGGFIQLAADLLASLAGLNGYFVRHLAGFARGRVGLTMLFFF